MTIRTEADDGRPADCVYGRSDSLCAYGLLARSAAVSAAAAVRVAGGPTTDGAKEREREREREGEREGAFGSAIVTWYETRPPPSPPRPALLPPPPPKTHTRQ